MLCVKELYLERIINEGILYDFLKRGGWL